MTSSAAARAASTTGTTVNDLGGLLSFERAVTPHDRAQAQRPEDVSKSARSLRLCRLLGTKSKLGEVWKLRRATVLGVDVLQLATGRLRERQGDQQRQED